MHEVIENIHKMKLKSVRYFRVSNKTQRRLVNTERLTHMLRQLAPGPLTALTKMLGRSPTMG